MIDEKYCINATCVDVLFQTFLIVASVCAGKFLATICFVFLNIHCMLFPWADLGCPEGIAIDHMSRNMYWTDSILDRIEVSRLDGSQRRVLFDDDLINPRPIIADPAYGYVCVWSRRYEEHTLIYDTHTALRPPDTCTGPTGTATGPRSSAPVWTGATGRCWCRTGWGCPTLWPLTPRADGSAGRTQVSFTFIQQHASWITFESCGDY